MTEEDQVQLKDFLPGSRRQVVSVIERNPDSDRNIYAYFIVPREDQIALKDFVMHTHVDADTGNMRVIVEGRY